MSQPLRKLSSPGLTMYAGALVVQADAGANAPDDIIDLFAGDEKIGDSPLRAVAGQGPRLIATIQLGAAPVLSFPITLRAMNRRTGREIGRGVRLGAAEDLLRAVGPAVLSARVTGLSREGVALAVKVERLHRYSRPFVLRTDGTDAASGDSVLSDEYEDEQTVAFKLNEGLRPGANLELVDVACGATVALPTLTTDDIMDAAMSHIAVLERRLDHFERDRDRWNGRAQRAVEFGTERLLLDRLDLFYLLLSDRIDREMRLKSDQQSLPAPESKSDDHGPWHVAPGDVEGVGMYDLETNGSSDWRWFGPEVTIVFRDVPGPLDRIVLTFHSFGENGRDNPSVRASLGVSPVAAELRPDRADGHVLDIPVPSGIAFPDGSVILHLSFGHHHTSEADPRLLSAVFSGAELFGAH